MRLEDHARIAAGSDATHKADRRATTASRTAQAARAAKGSDQLSSDLRVPVAVLL